MKGKLHIPALWLNASDFSPFFQKLSLRTTLFSMLCTLPVQMAWAHLKNNNTPAFAPTLTLEASGPASAACGDTVTINITAISGFVDIGSLQHSVNWDETQLMYLSHNATQIGGIGGDPLVGTGNTAGGELAYSWVDPSGLDGEDLPDSTLLMTITFKVITGSGTAAVDITGTPLAIEVADNLLAIGTVIVQNNVSIALAPVAVTLVLGDDEACPNDTALILTGGSPPGGIYSGAGVTADSIFNAVLAGVGEHVITYTYADSLGCNNSATDTITVGDFIPPIISCPIPTLTDTADINCELVFSGTSLDATATDNCGLDSIINDFTNTATLDGAVFPGGTTVVTWTATDVGGNTASCTVEITVADLTPPTITCPVDMTVDTDPGNCDAVVNGLTATPVDNCPVIVTWSVTSGPALAGAGTSTASDASGAVFALGTTVVEYLATDPGGNTATCSFSVTVEDNEMFAVTPLPPGLVTFQDTFDVNTAPGACSQNVSWYRASFLTHLATDNCPDTFAITEGVAIVNGTPDPGFFTSNGVTPFPYDFTNPLHQVTPVSAAFPVGTTVIPYYFIDSHSDTVTIVVVVNVEETEPPVATCVSGLVLSLDGTGNVVLLPNMVDNGSSDNCGIVILSVEPDTFDCSDVGANNVVLTVNDLSPLSPASTCSTVVTVVDDVPPVVNCPVDITASADSNSCNNTASAIPGLSLTLVPSGDPLTGSGQYTDNCGVKTITYVLSGPSGTSGSGDYPIPGAQVFNVGVTNVTYTFRDTAGNTTVCSFDVTVEDLVPPTTLDCPNPPPVNANLGSCLAQVNWTPPTFTDNCPGALFLFNTHAPGSFFFFDSTLVTYTATDVAGNIGICTFYVVVNDAQPPVANCNDITVFLDSNGIVTVNPAQLDNGSTDNCFYEYVNPDTTFNCTNMGQNSYTLTIEDAGGDTDTATCLVFVEDVIPPVIADCGSFIPADVSLDANCQGTLDASVYALNFTVTDNTLNSNPACPLSFDVEVDGSGFSPVYQWTCVDVGTNTVVLRVSDVFGNTAVCTTTITVNDVTPPAIINADSIAPPALTVECDDYDETDFATLGQITLADVTDACDDACDDDITIAFSDTTAAGACDNAFTVTRTWKVTDQAGNMTTHVQTISVVDTQAPTFNIPTTVINLEANNQNESPPCVAPFTVALLDGQILDNCTPPLVSFFDVFYSIQFPLGPPTPFQAGASVTTTFPLGTSVVTFNVTDPCGNSSQTTFTVNVEDVDGPVVVEPFANFFGNTQKVCDSTFTILNATNNCGNNFSWYRPYKNANEENFLDCSAYTVTETISDPTVQSAINASSPFVYLNPPIFSIHPTTFFPVGQTVITYMAVSGNDTTICAFTVQILDNQAPTIACPSDQSLSISSGCANATTVPSYLNGVQITDNCPTSVLLAQTPPPGTLLSNVVNPAQAGQTFTITMSAKDSFPNQLPATPCTFTVTLTDGEAPVPDEPFLPTIIGFCGVDTVDAPSATDCDGTNFVTIYGTPSVTVVEILPPLVPGGPPRYVIPSGNYAITWSYTDPQNNTTTQLQNVQVISDTNPPIAICKPPFSVNLSAAGDYLLDTDEIDNGSSDPDMCGPIMLSLQPSVLTCSNLNLPANVTLTVTDVAGNTAQCVTQVTVNDVTAPVLSPIPANTTLEACVNIPAPALITATDICDQNVAIAYKQDTVAFINAYSYTLRRTWTATDDSGNSSTGTQLITIQDTQAPVFSANVPDTIMVVTDLDDLDCEGTASFNILPFVEDCDSTTLTITNNRTGQGADYSEVLPIGTYTLVFTAIDGNGNSSTRAIILVIKDGTNPIAVCINGVSVALQPSGNVTVTPQNINSNSSDNCTTQNNLMLSIQRLDPLGPIANSVTFNCADADGVTQHPVRLYVKDEAGNESTCETFVIVQDNVPPTITFCPTSVTVQCDADLSPNAQGTATGADNCNLITVEFADTTGTGTGNICTVIYRTWKVLDQAGNSATCVQTLNVQDLMTPAFSMLPPANISLNCADTVAVAPVLTATDNCDDDVAVTLAVDTINVAPGACGLFSYTIERTWTATDDCGNTSVFTQLVNVTDAEAPQFTGLPDTLTLFSADFPPNLNCLVQVSLDASQYVSDCSPDSLMTFSNNAPHGDGELDISGDYTVGTYSVTFTAIDACGNAGQDSIVIQITDNSIPTAICNDSVVISLGSNGQAVISPDVIDLGSSDNCGIETMFLSDSIFDCGDLGLQPVTLTVVDASGNSNFCTVNVDVVPGSGGAGFSLDVTGSPESYFGADDGSASAVATGGSGQFTFLWSNSATTPDIMGLPAGVYTVTVIDSIGGCTRVDTAVVDAGAKLTLTVGVGEGCQGEIISIPVTADNFFDVTSFMFTLHVEQDTVGTILGITSGSIHPAIADEFNANLLIGNNLGVDWADTSLTLPNGAVLFNLDVQLGTAVVGSSSATIITGTPVAILFMQDSSGFNVVTSMIVIENDTLKITCEQSDNIEIGGDIQTWNNPKPVPGVELTLTGDVAAMQTTDTTGTYLFGVPNNSNTTVRCFKETAGNDAITGADILLIKRHVLNLQPLTSPYQFVAADVSGEGNLSILDYSRIQLVALALEQHIPGSPDWKFVPKSYVFPTPPLSVPFPDSISHLPATASFLDDDFVAVRMGDVNGNIMPTFTGNDDADDRSETLLIRLDEQNYKAGETIAVPFRASHFSDRSGFQMTLRFDPQTLELEAIEPRALPDMSLANFGAMRSEEGYLTIVWVTPIPLTLADGEVFFTLKFKTLREGASLAEVLRPSSDFTRAEAYDRDGSAMKIDFEFVQPRTGIEPAAFALYQNQPNPFSGKTIIGFQLPEACEAQLRIFDTSGRMLAERRAQYAAGRQEEIFNLAGVSGVLYYELVTPFGTLTQKMTAAN